jgi:hypothetical protein
MVFITLQQTETKKKMWRQREYRLKDREKDKEEYK